MNQIGFSLGMKMKNLIKNLISSGCGGLVLFLLVSGCSGGGSGSGDAGRTAVRVVHAAIDTAPLDVYSSETVGLISMSRFAAQTRYYNARQGGQLFSLTVSGTSRTVFSVPLTVVDGQRQTILVHGNRDSLGLRVSTFLDEPGEISGGESALRVVHALGGAAKLDCQLAGAVICSGLDFGNASIYSKVKEGIGKITVRRVADRKVVFDSELAFESGKAYSLVVTGEEGYFVTAPLLLDN